MSAVVVVVKVVEGVVPTFNMNPYSLNIYIFNQILQYKHSSHVPSFKQILHLICFPKGEKDVLLLIYSENIFPFSIQVETIVNKFSIVFNPGTVEFIRYIYILSFHPTPRYLTLHIVLYTVLRYRYSTIYILSFHIVLYTVPRYIYFTTYILSFHPTLHIVLYTVPRYIYFTIYILSFHPTLHIGLYTVLYLDTYRYFIV